MAKPLNQFGGWLTFFYIVFWYGLISWCVMGVLSVIALFNRASPILLQMKMVYLVEAIVFSYLSIKLIRMMREKDLAVPNKMLRLTLACIFLQLLFFSAEFAIVYFLQNKTLSIHDFLDSTSLSKFGPIFMIYLESSKRVKAYYGANAAWESLIIKYKKD